MPESPALLLGSNLAVAVAALALARDGRRSVLFTDGRSLGGHFRGLEIEGHRFDLGAVMIERPPDPALVPWSAVACDWRRSGARIDAFLASWAELRRVPTPESLVGSTRWPDHLVSNRLDILRGRSAPPLPDVDVESPLHPANKNVSGVYDRLTLREASALTLGQIYYEELVEPFIQKVVGRHADSLLARHHRAAWAPLYWPETVKEAFSVGGAALSEYPFWVPAAGSVAELVSTILRDIEMNSLVTVCRTPLANLATIQGRVRAVDTNGRSWEGELSALGLPSSRSRSLVGLPPPSEPATTDVSIAFCLVPSHAIRRPFSSLSVVARRWSTYRVTDLDHSAGGDPAWHRVVIEARPAIGMTEALEGQTLVEELRAFAHVPSSAGVRMLRVVRLRKAFVVPVAADEAVISRERAELVERLPQAVLMGQLLGPQRGSMNEQILQGLEFAEETVVQA